MDEKLLKKLFDAKLPYDKIAEKLQTTKALVAYYVKKFNFTPRNKYSTIVRRAGDVIDDWTLLESFIQNHKTYWTCRCKCGVVKNVNVSSLNRGRSKSCRGCAVIGRKKLDKNMVPNAYFIKLRFGALRRGIKFSLSKTEITQLLELQNFKCILTGLSIGFKESRRKNDTSSTTASLDRIDSDKGYESGNIQWVHKDINKMKQTFSQEYFIELCQKVVNFKSG